MSNKYYLLTYLLTGHVVPRMRIAVYTTFHHLLDTRPNYTHLRTEFACTYSPE